MILGIRPEDLEDAELATDTPADQRLTGEVELREALGSELIVHFSVPGAGPRSPRTSRELARDVGDDSSPAPARDRRASSSDASARARASAEGEPVEVAVDTRSLHFFDPGDGSRDLRRQTR